MILKINWKNLKARLGMNYVMVIIIYFLSYYKNHWSKKFGNYPSSRTALREIDVLFSDLLYINYVLHNTYIQFIPYDICVLYHKKRFIIFIS